MSTTVEIPGGTAVLKDDSEMTNKEVKTLRRSARAASSVALHLEEMGYDETNPESWKALSKLPEEEYDNLDIFQRTCVLIRLKSWTLDRPIPTTEDEVDDLPRNIFVPITTAAANVNLSDEFGIEGAGDPKVDTDASDN
jgi:hypothetical protein